MKKELTCSIVQDLLPNYIENLTSEMTNQTIEEHLETCVDCKNVHAQMNADTGSPYKIPTIELRFLKKVKRTRLLAAVICVILTIVLSCLLYNMEFMYTIDKTDLSGAVTDFMAPFEKGIEAYVLETKEIDGILLASFKDQNHENINGIATYIKGINNKYRIVHTDVESSEYSNVIQFYTSKIKDKKYIAVSGYNLSDEIKYYGLDYWTYSNPGHLSDDRVRETVKLEVKNQQFMEVYEVEEIETLLLDSAERELQSYFLVETSLYDADGVEVSEDYIIPEKDIERISSGAGKVELFLLYVFIAIVLGLGIVSTRYFLTE